VTGLVGQEPAASLCKSTRAMIVIFWLLVWLFRDRLYLRAQRAEQMHFLRRLIVRNHNNGAISPRPPDDCKPNPSVTGGSLNDRCAQFKATRCLRVSNDAIRGSIFHRAGRIHELRLSQNLASRQFGQAPPSNKLRGPNVAI